MTRLAGNYPSRSRNGKIELKILNQPEEQHRARYLTEGSRGSIKDGTGLGHPVVKLFGFNGCPVKLQCFIGHDKHIGVPHLFYQASRITGKNSTRCSTTKIEGTAVITLDLTPENNMQTTIDCIGILKERNVDVEQKVLRLKSLNGSYNNGEAVNFPSKKRCAKCRLVFRCKLPGSNEILQAVSTPILCTQPVGTPEICKISLTECKASGGKELYIIGKNFLKDSKVIFKNDDWCKIIEPDKEYLHSSHLICMIPPYDGPNHELPGYFTVSISIRSGGKYSDSHSFTYINDSKANSVLIQRSLPANNHHHHHGSYPDMIQKQVFLSHLGHGTCDSIKREESQICRMANSKSMLNQSIPMDTGRYYSEDTLLSSDSSTISETILASEDSCFSNQSTITSPHSGNNVEMTDFMGRINGSSPLIHGSNEGTYDDQRSSLSYNNEPNGVIVSQLRNSMVPQDTRFLDSESNSLMKIGTKAENQLFGVPSLSIIPGPNCPSALAAVAAVTQSGPTSCTAPTPLSNPSNNLPPNCMEIEKTNLTASQLMPPPPAPCSMLSKEEQLPPGPPTLDTSQLIAPPSEPSGPVLDARPNSDHHPVSPTHTVNGPLPPTAPTPVTNITSPSNVGSATRPPVPGAGPTIIQASQISAMSQMSDSELIRLINPSTFDEFKEDVSSMFNFGFPSSHLFRK